jgi:hypothetical protein
MRRITLPVAIAISFGLVVLTVAILYAMGRPLIPKSVPLRIWGPPDSQHLFDAYTFTHMLHAPFYYLLIWLVDRGRLSVPKRLLLCVFIECGWEIFENTPFIINRYQEGGVADYTGDSIVNSIGDLLAMLTGFGLTVVLLQRPAWAVAALFAATEVILYLTIKSGFLIDFLGLLRGFINI